MMSRMDKHIIPTSEMHITHNDCKLLFDMIDKELEDKMGRADRSAVPKVQQTGDDPTAPIAGRCGPAPVCV